MTPQSKIRRMGWIAVLTLCVVLYAMLHLKVNTVHSEVVQAERQIVALEEQNMLLETEFLTRSSQVRLAAWNRVDFGYQSPTAAQFVAKRPPACSIRQPTCRGRPGADHACRARYRRGYARIPPAGFSADGQAARSITYCAGPARGRCFGRLAG